MKIAMETIFFGERHLADEKTKPKRDLRNPPTYNI